MIKRARLSIPEQFMKRLSVVGLALCTAAIYPDIYSLRAETTALQQANVKVSGTVVDSKGESLVGVNVVVKGTTIGTMTDFDGKFSLDVPQNATLEFSYIGYKPQNVPVGKQHTFKVTLEEDAQLVSEVVVVGYGTQKKANLTGAVSTIDVGKSLESRPVTDVSKGLQGVAPGLTISATNGEIGKSSTIRLRGSSGSLNAVDGAKPLILVDNVEVPDLNLINPDDIESISVLKDAASTSIYGTRGAWGVILLTTKNPKKDASFSVSYTNNFSFNKPTKTPNIAGSFEGAEMALMAAQRSNPNSQSFGAVGYNVDALAIEKMKEWRQLYGGKNLGPEMVMGRDFEIRGEKLYFYREWDVNEEFMRKYTPQQNHNVSVTGSNKGINYILNLGYLGQEGVLKTNPDKFQRYNASLGVNSEVNKYLTLRSKIFYTSTGKDSPYNFGMKDVYDPWYYLYRWPSFYPYGSMRDDETGELRLFRSAVSEVQQANLVQTTDEWSRINLGATVNIMKDLTFDVDYTYTGANTHIHSQGGSAKALNFWSGIKNGQISYETYTDPMHNRVKYESLWNSTNTFKGYLTYGKSFGQNQFKVMGGADIEDYRYRSQMSERRNLIDPSKPELGLATGDQYVTGTRGSWSTAGFFGRINYSYADKYLLEVNGRYDGSSKFPAGELWGFFPSFSAGWRITEEKFMKPLQPVLSTMKIRGSWGSVGNQDVGNYRFISIMGTQNSNWLINGNNQLQINTPSIISSNLTWERVKTLDLGFDSRFFNDKLGVSFDWYQRDLSDMISGGITLPSTFGGDAPARNYGEMRTRGWEIAVDFGHTFSNGLRLNATAMVSDFTERITKYASTVKDLNKNYEGKILGEIWGYETDGIFQEADFAIKNPTSQDKWGDRVNGNIADQSKFESGWFYYGPGDIRYKDLNGDGKIDNGKNTLEDHGDLKRIGNSTPRYQYSFRVGANYKGFDADIFFQGVGKRDIWASGSMVIPGFRPAESWYQHQTDYWTPQNTNAFYPRPTDQGQSNNAKNFLPQTRYLLDMSYLRCKNITLGYTVPSKITRKAMIDKLRIYVSGENLFEFDNLKVPVDPEMDYSKTQYDNDKASFGRSYPFSRSFSFGLQVTFK